MKKMMNEWKKFLAEDFQKDKFPFPDTASQEEADAIFTGGFKDGDPVDDKIPVNRNAGFTCGQLNPSQKEVRVTDAVEFGMWMIEGKYEIGGNLGAIVSKDNFIMDGHHRWAGSWLAGGPSTKMVAVQVGLPKDELIPVLAAIGDHFHPGKRNPGAKGGVANIFSSDVSEIGKYIRRLNEEDGITKYMTKAQANAITEKAGGIDALTERFEKHAAQMKEQKGGKIKGLPPREEMPVIKSGEVEDAVVAIEKGQVDIFSPYRPELKEATDLPSEILTEVLTDRLYHYSNVDNLKNIIQKDYFLPSVAFTSGAEEEINKGYKYFISFARNLRGTYHREGKGVGYLVVDGRKLSQKYKGGAVDYWQWGSGADRPKKTEAEDRLLTNKPYVKGATEFIDAVHISAPYATEIGSKMYTEKYSEGLVDILRDLDNVARANNIPVYFHTDLGSYRMANDKKAVDFVEWENGAVKAGVIEPSFTGGYKPPPRDLMRLEVVTKTIEELLVKGVSYKEFKDSLSEREREFLTRRFLYSFTGDDIAKKIIEAIRNVRDGEDDRPYIARIGRAMTKLKMNIAEMGIALGDIVSKAVRGLTEYPGDHDIDPDEPYGDNLFVAGDGETNLERFQWSQKTSAKLRSFVRNASTRNKKELHDILKQIQAMADEGTLSSYYDELKPPAGKVYRGMLVPAKAAASWGLIDPNNPPEEGKLQKKNNFVFKSSWYPSGLTSWSYSPDVASGFTSLYSDETEAGEKYVSIVLSAEASDPGFILNHKNVKMLAVAGEEEVLFIGDEVGTTAYYKYYDGGTENYEASEVDASELTEATKLPKEIFTAFEEEIMKSNFWNEYNDYEDLEFDEDNPKKPPQTPATMALTLAMNKALKRAGLDDVVGVAESSGDFSNNMWQSATIDIAEDGTPVFMVLMNLWEDFDDFGESAEEAVADISAAFRHELVHLQQLKAQAKSKGVGLEKAFTKMMDDPKQVVDRDQPKYWEVWEPTGKKDKDGKEIIKKDGFKSELFMKDYLERHIEIDAHAHQAGENLLRKYGEEKALDTISKDIDLDDPSLPAEVKKYDNYKVDKKKMDKFRSKVYTYIKKFVEDQA